MTEQLSYQQLNPGSFNDFRELRNLEAEDKRWFALGIYSSALGRFREAILAGQPQSIPGPQILSKVTGTENIVATDSAAAEAVARS